MCADVGVNPTQLRFEGFDTLFKISSEANLNKGQNIPYRTAPKIFGPAHTDLSLPIVRVRVHLVVAEQPGCYTSFAAA